MWLKCQGPPLLLSWKYSGFRMVWMFSILQTIGSEYVKGNPAVRAKFGPHVIKGLTPTSYPTIRRNSSSGAPNSARDELASQADELPHHPTTIHIRRSDEVREGSTYALYERSHCVLGLLLVCGGGVISVGIWGTISSGKAADHRAQLPPYIGCTYEITQRQLHLFRVRADEFQAKTIADASPSVIVISNVSNILTYILGEPSTRGVATTFTNIISSIMISRLMLNLRDPVLTSRDSEARSDESEDNAASSV
ncbi:hypothetical protein B0H19DRAFT_1083096 [Mycena capillaripes]|nr:hypothetical protein B0H19DRAFT_1083096 [Mycena capillaripes]